jgi:hypothetical protein
MYFPRDSAGSCFFIVGVPRSGTTVLRLALNSHREICVPSETWFFPKLSRRAAVYGDFSAAEQVANSPATWPAFGRSRPSFGSVFEITEAGSPRASARGERSLPGLLGADGHFAEREGKRCGARPHFYLHHAGAGPVLSRVAFILTLGLRVTWCARCTTRLEQVITRRWPTRRCGGGPACAMAGRGAWRPGCCPCATRTWPASRRAG